MGWPTKEAENHWLSEAEGEDSFLRAQEVPARPERSGGAEPGWRMVGARVSARAEQILRRKVIHKAVRTIKEGI